MIETIIVAALVMWSALVVFKKVFPQTANSFFMTVSNMCSQRGWSTLAKWFKPAMVLGCSGGCGCSVSEDKEPQKTQVQAVKWK